MGEAVIAPYLLALVISANPVSVEPPTERVDLIEANAHYDLNGVLLLRQAIFYEWDDFTARHQVVAWRLIKTDATAPRACEDGYEMVWSEGGRHLRVTAPKYRATWTQIDPEVMERRHLPSDQRKGIFNEKRPTKDGTDPLPPAPPQ